MKEPVKLLLIDPDDQIGEACRRALASVGWIMHHAHSFSEALELLEQSSYDVAMVEVMLPDVLGTDAWRYIKTVRPAILGVMTTGSAVLHHSIDARDRGILAFLLKPVDMDWLRCQIEQHSGLKMQLEKGTHLEPEMSMFASSLAGIIRALAPHQLGLSTMPELETAIKTGSILVYLFGDPQSAWSNHFMGSFSAQAVRWTEAEFTLLQSMMLQVVQSEQVIIIDRSAGTSGGENAAETSLGAGVIVPLAAQNRTFGALGLVNHARSEQALTPVEIDLVATLGKSVAHALDDALLADAGNPLVTNTEELSGGLIHERCS